MYDTMLNVIYLTYLKEVKNFDINNTVGDYIMLNCRDILKNEYSNIPDTCKITLLEADRELLDILNTYENLAEYQGNENLIILKNIATFIEG